MEPKFYIKYGFLGLPKRKASAFQIDRKTMKAKHFFVYAPRILKIDPRGHFTFFRCCAIILFDRLMVRFKWTRERLANLCEFLANYPNF